MKPVRVRKLKEWLIEKAILLSGIFSVVFVLLIFLFLLREGFSLFRGESVIDFLFGKSWYPISEPAALRHPAADPRFSAGHPRRGGHLRAHRRRRAPSTSPRSRRRGSRKA